MPYATNIASLSKLIKNESGRTDQIWLTRRFKNKRAGQTNSRGTVQDNLTLLRGLVEQGMFKPVIDRKYTLEKIADAYSYVASGQKIGNVIITMDA